MTKKFLLAVVASAVTAVVPNAIITATFYYDFLKSHSPLTEMGIWDKVQIPADQTKMPAAILTILCIGFLLTTVMYWANSKTFLQGLKRTFIFAMFMVGMVNFGLIATTHYWSYTSGIVDIFVASITFAPAGGVASWILGKGKTV